MAVFGLSGAAYARRVDIVRWNPWLETADRRAERAQLALGSVQLRNGQIGSDEFLLHRFSADRQTTFEFLDASADLRQLIVEPRLRGGNQPAARRVVADG